MKPIYIMITVLQNMFDPKTIALVGASRYEGKVGHILLKNLKKSGKKIFPVNPNAHKILGLKTYKSILDIKEKVDLAIIVIPAKFVLRILDLCGVKGIKKVMVISAGFSETGNEELEDEVQTRAKMHGIKLIGPNCMGFINTEKDLNASFFEGMPEKGKVAFISQSGALGSAMLDWAIQRNIGLSYFFSIGNMADIDFADIIDFLQKDKKTKLIVLYMESLKDGRNFFEATKRSKKPIAVIKAGTSKAGSKAAASHTGALAGSDKIYSGVFKQAGVVRMDKIEDLLNVSKCVHMGKIPNGKKLLILTNAGGPGVLAADSCEKYNVLLPKVSKEISNRLNKILPHNWSKNNPIDIVGDADPIRFKKTFDIVKKSSYDMFLVLLTPQAMTEPMGTSKEVVKFSKNNKPVFSCFMGGDKIKWAVNYLEKNKIPNFQEPEEACKTIYYLLELFGNQQ